MVDDRDDENKEQENQDEDNESFAELLESYSDSSGRGLKVGDRISGSIISIGREAVFVDTGSKRDGVIDRDELLDDEGEIPYSVGDEVELYVVGMTPDEVKLSKAFSGPGDPGVLREAYRNEVPVEGKVKAPCKGGFHVEIMKLRAFCPISQMDMRYIEDPSVYVGAIYPFLITRFEENGRNIVVSRREILERETEEARGKFLESLGEDAEVEGTVTKLMPYGAFVELVPGLEGMIHISELSWSRVEKPDEILRPGDKVTARVIGVKQGAEGRRPRIALSLKQMQGDPWERVNEFCSEGDRIKGKVVRCAEFGAFVEIAPGVEGLVHLSEMSHAKRVLKPEELVSPGDEISVVVKQIDTQRRRIALSIRDVEGDPWSTVEELFRPGQVVDGVVEREERYGLFITLAPGVTGLLHRSKLEGLVDAETIDKLKRGDHLRVIVESINPQERRISLDLRHDSGETEWRTFSDKPEGKGDVGALGEKLKDALDKKED
ncbi:MAG: 30S ribosomal protein S1 [Thermodesulfobacteriota bacterium]